MGPIPRRKWYAAALGLILGAIAAQLVAEHHARRGMWTMASAAAVPAERLQLQRIAFWHAHHSDLWGLISLGLALLAVSSWLVSRTRREPGPHAVMLVLLCLFVLLLLIIV